jgi:hypothetical protein
MDRRTLPVAAAATLATAFLSFPASAATPAGSAGVVPGVTGAAARQQAGAAATRFLQMRTRQAVVAAQLHTDWGLNLPNGASAGLHATQSVITTGATTTTGGDYVYAPTAIPAGGACIEMTTAYTPTGPYLWAWDWCGGRDGVGKLTPMNAAFLSTYTSTVNGHAAYQLDVHKTSSTANTWTAYLYNVQTKAWDTYFTSTGTYDLPQFPFGWDMFEIYTTSGSYCHDLTGQAFDSSAIQVYANNAWAPADTTNAQTTSRTIPSGSAYDCPQLTFSVPHPNDHWVAQIGGSAPPSATSYEAEAGARTGQAAVRSSAGASGGAVVGYVGNGAANTVSLTVSVASAGSHTVSISYASGAARSVTLTVNGAAGPTVSTPSTGGWDTIGSVSTTVNLNAGTNTVQLGNATGWAPDLDRIVVS